MDPGYRSPLVDLFLRGTAAPDIRLLAARGLLPRPVPEQIALLVVLSDDADPEIAAHANATIARLPREALAGFLATDAPPELRAFFAARGALPQSEAAQRPRPRRVTRQQHPIASAKPTSSDIAAEGVTSEPGAFRCGGAGGRRRLKKRRTRG